MFHPCRLLVFLTLVFVSLLASSPAFATRDTPEENPCCPQKMPGPSAP